ncbi:MAG: UDP-N-acetylmuramate dehydrogenase [Ginsengibacter sp.]
MQIQRNFPLKKYNTFGVQATSKLFASFSSADELISLLNTKENLPIMILGGGSNILFTKDFHGLLLKNDIGGIEIVSENAEYIYVKVGAGVQWHEFVMFCVNNNFAGVENLSLIPGNSGASPMQNIGAYGVEVKDVFFELESLHLKDKIVQKFSGDDCEFGYRESVFKKKYKNQFAILNVTYRLKKKPDFNISYGAIEAELQKMNVEKLTVKSISDAVIRIRTSKLPDPAIIGNAGSFFKNPVISKKLFEEKKMDQLNIPFYNTDEEHLKIPAGWLIEKCGWKGYRKNDAGCYDKQALVLVNYGNATGREIYDLSEEIKISVKEKYNIDLEREVNNL